MKTRQNHTEDASAQDKAIDDLAAQLRRSLDNGFQQPIKITSAHEGLHALTAMINDVIGNAQHAVDRLESMNRDLDHVIRQRMAELEHARSVAESGSLAKTNFLAQMGHELRTPLNAVIGFAQLLIDSRKEVLSERQNKQAGHILRSGQHLLGLINDVLDLSKIETGNFELRLEVIDPEAIITESLQMISPLIGNADIRFENRIDTDAVLPPVLCDFLRTKQCLINLLNNAFKYNKANGLVWIDVTLIKGERIRFTVGDSGIGIPKNKRHELFRPFSRLGREDTGVEGSGVGLALTRLLVLGMEGVLDFDSIEGQGSRFWFELPVSQLPPTTAEDNQPVKAIDVKRAQGLILYIEDMASNVALMQDILSEFTDVQLIAVTTAEEGIRIAMEQLPDLILMDVNLAGMSGIDATRYIRSATGIKNIPIIALTGDAREETRKRCEDAGVDLFFSKPFNVQSFVDAVSKMLDQRLGSLL